MGSEASSSSLALRGTKYPIYTTAENKHKHTKISKKKRSKLGSGNWRGAKGEERYQTVSHWGVFGCMRSGKSFELLRGRVSDSVAKKDSEEQEGTVGKFGGSLWQFSVEGFDHMTDEFYLGSLFNFYFLFFQK